MCGGFKGRAEAGWRVWKFGKERWCEVNRAKN